MKKIRTKVFLMIFLCSFVSVSVLGMTSIRESSQRAKLDAERTLLWMAKDYADKFSTEFRIIEDQLNEIAFFLESTLDLQALQTDRSYLATYELILAEFLNDFAEKRSPSKAGWAYFDPKWSDSPHDVYFVDGDGDGLAERQAHIPFSYYDNTPRPNDDKQWWYGPIATGKTFWTNPYEWALVDNQHIKVVSCARPFYLDDVFIGVFGTYYRFDAMYEEISDTRVYDSGYAALFNEKADVVIHPTFFSGTRFTSDNLLSMDNEKYRLLAETILQSDSGVYPYTEDGKDMIMAHAKLSNGWVLGITPPTSELYSPVQDLIEQLLWAIFGCVLLSLIAAYGIGRYLSEPILTLATAARRIGQGDFSVRTHLNSQDELQLLADSMNSMTESIHCLQAELVQQAYYDELTGAKNLSRFKLDASILLQQTPTLPYVLLKFDIDKFKLLNELYGFSVGDEVLCHLVLALESILDPALEPFARITADEFVILCLVDTADALNDKRRRFHDCFTASEAHTIGHRIFFKEGLYHPTPEERDVSLLFEKVNLAHRISKQRDDCSICVYDDSVRQLVREEKAIETRMQKALENKEFQLYLQPKYQLSDETIVGVEALVRWQNEDGSLLMPDQFIPLFERNGFIKKLDFYMLEQSCQALRDWHARGLPALNVSVNFSRVHLNTPHFLSRMCQVIDQYQIPRHCIEMELTETAMLYNADTLISFSNSLHETGIRLSMDDFGSGYSSLGLLKNIPVDVIKLDRSFFMGAEDTARSLSVLRSIIRMAKELGIKVVAEGVEEKSHILLLKRLACDIVQGYYYAKPMPCADFVTLLARSQEIAR